MKQVSQVSLVKKAVRYNADTISKNKAGNIVIRKGYFYRNGTAEAYADRVVSLMRTAGLSPKMVKVADCWKPFRGGASLANQSHFYVEISL